MNHNKTEGGMDPVLDLAIQKGTETSLHQQLVTQICLQIASGKILAGTKLPSVRDLSKQLGIHYNTVHQVYKEIEFLGMVAIRKGSGVIVEAFPDGSPPPAIRQEAEQQSLQTLSLWFLRHVMRRGYDWEAIQASLQWARQALEEAGTQTFLFVDRHADMLPIFQAELQGVLGEHVSVQSLGALEPETIPEGTTLLVSRYHHQSLLDVVGSDYPYPIVVLDISQDPQQVTRIQQLPESTFLAIISTSSVMLQMAESMVHALRGNELLLKTVLITPHASSQRELEIALQHAHGVFADCLCAPRVQSMTSVPVEVVHFIPPQELDKIKGTPMAPMSNEA